MHSIAFPFLDLNRAACRFLRFPCLCVTLIFGEINLVGYPQIIPPTNIQPLQYAGSSHVHVDLLLVSEKSCNYWIRRIKQFHAKILRKIA